MFQFKQFTIHQDQCAMKVSTDACILGAYVPVENAQHILDIGTGTGLLSLMMAQRTNGLIEAVEIDMDAFEQANANVKASKFEQQIRLHHTPIQSFAPAQRYDCIVSNPPFFQNHLKSERQTKNLAHHTDSLSFEELIAAVERLVVEDGLFVVLLPDYEMGVITALCEKNGLYAKQTLSIRHRAGSKILRKITIFSRKRVLETAEELLIKDDQEQYTDAFKALLGAYYLIF